MFIIYEGGINAGVYFGYCLLSNQGSYGVVKLAYNEYSEEYYVSYI